MAPAMSLAEMQAYVKAGETLAELGKERMREAERREQAPGAEYAKLLAAQLSKSSDPAISQQMLASAAVKAKPNQRRAPTTELEQLVYDQPRTSAQVVGHHKVPQVTVPKPPPKKLSELERMRTVFSSKTSGEVGFHHDFGVAKRRDAEAATALVGRLQAQQVATDPTLAAALAKLRTHVIVSSQKYDCQGSMRGLQTRD